MPNYIRVNYTVSEYSCQGESYLARLAPALTPFEDDKLTKRIGALTVDLLREVDRGLRVAMDLD